VVTARFDRPDHLWIAHVALRFNRYGEHDRLSQCCGWPSSHIVPQERTPRPTSSRIGKAARSETADVGRKSRRPGLIGNLRSFRKPGTIASWA
jgi:hypothetical protein